MPKRAKKKVKHARKQKPVFQNNRSDESRDRNEFLDFDRDTNVDNLETPIKSAQDPNNYKVIKLSNGMVVLLVACPKDSSTEADKCEDSATDAHPAGMSNRRLNCGCSSNGFNWFDSMLPFQMDSSRASLYLTVGAGCFSDPRQIPGVAGILTECIFGNFKQYLEESWDLDESLFDEDGFEDFDCGPDTTTFEADVREDRYDEFCERLSEWLIDPSLNLKEVKKQRQHMEATYFTDSQCRRTMEKKGKELLFSNLASARHPAKTLGPHYLRGLLGLSNEQVFKEVLKFKERNYSAHRMTLVLKARLPIETLEEYATTYFSKIPKNDIPPRDLSQYNFTNSFDKSRKIYTMRPTDLDNYALELNWVLPPAHWLYRSKPRGYMAHFLKHEGEGSLLSYLRKRDWCDKITIDIGNAEIMKNSLYCVFSIKLRLTQEGNKKHKKILDAVFSYIRLMERAGPQERIFDELRKIEDAKFRFWSNFKPDHYFDNLSVNMHLYPPIDYLTGESLYLEYDHVSLRTCVELLTPDRATIIVYDVKAKKMKIETLSLQEALTACMVRGSDCEQSFKSHTSTDIPEDWLIQWKIVEPMPNFHLPNPNIFLTDDFTLIPAIKDPPRYPVKIHADALSEIWYKPDSKFRMPECCMNFRYITPLPLAEPGNAAMLDMYVEALKIAMAEEVYPALVAELKFVIKASEKGLVIEAHGFNQNMALMMKLISKYIAELPKLVTEDMFNRIKLEQMKQYRETLADPNKFCEELRLSIVRLVCWTSHDKKTAAAEIMFKHFQHFLERFNDHIYVQCLVQGNISKAAVLEDIRECVKISNCRPLSANTMPQLRAHELPRGQRFCRVKEFGSIPKGKVKTYYQISEAPSHRLAVMIDLLTMIMYGPAFVGLRLEERLDNVHSAEKHTFGMLGYSLVSSNARTNDTERGPDVEGLDRVASRIENLRKEVNILVKTFSERQLLGIKKTLLGAKRLPDPNLRSEVAKNWNEIITGEYVFNRREQEIAVIDALGVDDMRKWLAHLTTDASKLRTLSIQICPTKELTPISADQNTKKLDKDGTSAGIKSFNREGLIYLMNLPGMKEENPDNYITNIEEFKIGLKVLPIPKKGVAATATQPKSVNKSTTAQPNKIATPANSNGTSATAKSSNAAGSTVSSKTSAAVSNKGSIPTRSSSTTTAAKLTNSLFSTEWICTSVVAKPNSTSTATKPNSTPTSAKSTNSPIPAKSNSAPAGVKPISVTNLPLPNSTSTATKSNSTATAAKPNITPASAKPTNPPIAAKPTSAATATKPNITPASVKSTNPPIAAKPTSTVTAAKPNCTPESVKSINPPTAAKSTSTATATKPNSTPESVKSTNPPPIASKPTITGIAAELDKISITSGWYKAPTPEPRSSSVPPKLSRAATKSSAVSVLAKKKALNSTKSKSALNAAKSKSALNATMPIGVSIPITWDNVPAQPEPINVTAPRAANTKPTSNLHFCTICTLAQSKATR